MRSDPPRQRDQRCLSFLGACREIIEGTVSGWRIAGDGSLTLITTVGGIPANIFGPLSASMVAWDGPMDTPASFPSEMPPAQSMPGSGS